VLNRVWALAAVVWLTAVSASAQTAKPDAAASAAAAAAASAAMERAKRQAAGPMRFILEASRPRRKVAEAETVASADAANVRSVGGRPVPSVPAPAQATAEAVARPVTTAPLAATAEPVAQAPSPRAVAESTLNSELLQGKTAAPVPGLQTSGQAPLTTPLSSGPMALPAIAAGPARPKLVSQVDLDVPQRMLDELGRNALVLIDITIRVDGSVAAVALAGPAPRQLLRVVQAAVGQWRFEPLPSERVHRVELLFNADR